jgi:CTP:molybdopterin cytidylyltransferase MocA
MASSIRLGVNIAGTVKAQGVVLMTCDQVLLQPGHLRALCGESERITGSAYAGKIGIPAYFPADSFPDLLELHGNVGARDLLRRAAAIADEGLALDIDTQEDFNRAQELLEGY